MDRSDLGPSTYTYDELSQLLTAKLPDGDLQTYTFDPVGNRLSLQDHRGFQSYRYDSADQLLDVESDFNPEEPPATPASLAWASAGISDASVSKPLFRTAYSFDSDGNEVGKVGPGHRATTYGFNALDRLATVESPGCVPVRYGYNADGQRVAILQGQKAIKERFLRFGRGRPVLLDLDGSGKPTTRYLVLPGGQLLARVGPVDSKPVFYHFDALGSTLVLTDSSARALARFSYDPYGARRSFPVSGERFGFVGGESVADENSDLLEMGVRFYDPTTGRFIGVDPVRWYSEAPLLAHFSRYGYASNNPLRLTDPSGLDKQPLTPGQMGKLIVHGLIHLALAWCGIEVMPAAITATVAGKIVSELAPIPNPPPPEEGPPPTVPTAFPPPKGTEYTT